MNTQKTETSQTRNATSLAAMLGLRCLDRVQISSRREVAEARAFARYTDKPQELPFYFFQRIVGDRIELRSPGGYACLVSPLDVCDVIPGTPLEIMAMPRAQFLKRLSLPVLERGPDLAGPEAYAKATVRYATKNKWGQVEFAVWFDDEALNESETFMAPLLPGERQRLEPFARRTVMPVQSRSGAAGYSADFGVQRAVDLHSHAARLFIQACRKGNTKAVERLASLGAAPMSLGAMNRLQGVAA